jgi:hypothetical protein
MKPAGTILIGVVTLALATTFDSGTIALAGGALFTLAAMLKS